MKIILSMVLTLLLSSVCLAQEKLPYREMPAPPSTFTATNVTARLIDGIGFRYYWATEGLREEDLSYRPNQNSRTTLETITHIYALSQVIVNSVNMLPNTPDDRTYAFDVMRKMTLENLKEASNKLKSSDDRSMKNFNMVFKANEKTSEFSFWYEINGPISDALWHIGQVVSFRRSSGNPFNEKVSLLQGKLLN